VRELAFVLLVGAALVMTGGALLAHHSFSMYEDRPTPLEGTVLEFKYTNPHTLIILRAKGEDGHTVIWTLEGPSPASLVREGWSNRSLRPGDQIKTTIYPSRENKTSGVYYPRFTTFRDGRPIGGN
jgi:Family of unknown function (DUF6152)